MNINSAVEGPAARIFHSIYRTLAAEFPQTYVFAHDIAARGRDQSTNILLVATAGDSPLPLAAWRDRAGAYRSSSYVDTKLVSQLVENLVENLPEMTDAPRLTDDFAPIETMSF